MAARLGGRAGLRGLRPGRRTPGGGTQELRPRAAAVPVGKPPPGAPARLHDRRRRDALQAAQRLPRAAPDGVRRVRSPGGERRPPRGWPPSRDHRAEHRGDHALDEARRLVDRLVARAVDAPARLLPLAAVAVPRVPRARPRLPEGGAGQVVPERPDGAGERAGAAGRDVRALRRRGGVTGDGAMVLQDHRLRAGAARRSRDRRLARGDQGSSAKLDRPVRGCRPQLPDRRVGRGRRGLHDPPGHAVRRDVLRARAGARARRAHRLGRGAGVRPQDRREEDRGAGRRGGEDRRLHRAARRQPGQRRADPDLRGRLRADGLRDGRDHGGAGARPARLRLRARLRPAGPARRRTGRRRGRRERAVPRAHGGRGARQLGRARRAPRARGRPPDRRAPGARGARSLRGQLPHSRLGLLAPALLGLPDSRSSTATPAGSFPSRRASCPSSCPTSRTSSPEGGRPWRRPRTG